MKKLSGALIAALVATASTALAGDDMKAFPEPGQGMVRYVVRLPTEADENGLKVQIIAGKTVEVDARNLYRLGGAIEADTITGWGYTRYVVSAPGPMVGTLMAVDPNEPKVAKFVAIGGEPYLVSYNSKLPLVVYAPEGVEVRFRIWRAEPGQKPFGKG